MHRPPVWKVFEVWKLKFNCYTFELVKDDVNNNILFISDEKKMKDMSLHCTIPSPSPLDPPVAIYFDVTKVLLEYEPQRSKVS